MNHAATFFRDAGEGKALVAARFSGGPGSAHGREATGLEAVRRHSSGETKRRRLHRGVWLAGQPAQTFRFLLTGPSARKHKRQ